MAFSFHCGYMAPSELFLNGSQLAFIIIWAAQDHYFTIKLAFLIATLSNYESVWGKLSHCTQLKAAVIFIPQHDLYTWQDLFQPCPLFLMSGQND